MTFRHLYSFHKIISTGLPINLFSLIPKYTHGYQTRTLGNIPTYQYAGLILSNIPSLLGPLLHGTKHIQRLEMHFLQFLRNT